MRLTLHCYSTALYSTWVFVDELRLLFDAGDGVAANLLGRAGKLRHVFLSHADRDHMMGLFQLVQLNPLGDRLVIHYPADCGSFPAMADFAARFDPHIKPPSWHPIRRGDEVSLGGNMLVRAVHNRHVAAPDNVTKSLSYFVVERKQVLRPDFVGLPQSEIKRMVGSLGREAITEVKERRLLAYSADTPVLAPDFWSGVNVLLHESTFLYQADSERMLAKSTHPHSHLGDVLAMTKLAQPKHLILIHFSTRYAAEQIVAEVKRLMSELELSFPVDLVLPGTVHRFELEI
ncbi:MAG: RNAse Z [Proteobacteria bacterium]|nr:RNAse Z [Pseudomonadota bacterium]